MRNPLDTLDTNLSRLMDAEPPRWFRWLLVALLSLISWVLYVYLDFIRIEIHVESSLMVQDYTIPVLAALFALLTAGTLAVVYPYLRRRGARTLHYLLMGAVVLVIGLVRMAPINYMSGDYINCLAAWAEKMRFVPFGRAISAHITDYNAPYNYLIFLLSKTHLPDLYLFKWISMVFDILCALLMMRIAEKYGKTGTLGTLLAFLLVMCWPTFVFNGALWAQCDSIYCTFALAAVYFALEDKPWFSVIAMGLSLCYKLQGVFILPMMLVLWGMGKIRIKHLLMIPGTYLLVMVPALLGGMPVHRLVSMYVDQAVGYTDLVLDAPSLFQLFEPTERMLDALPMVGITFAFCAVVILCTFLLYRRNALTSTLIWDASLLMTLVIPFLLPRMHDRYFYMAEVFALVYVCLHPRRFPVALLLMIASMNSYLAFLQGGPTFVPQTYTALLILGLLCYLSMRLVKAYLWQRNTQAPLAPTGSTF